MYVQKYLVFHAKMSTFLCFCTYRFGSVISLCKIIELHEHLPVPFNGKIQGELDKTYLVLTLSYRIWKQKSVVIVKKYSCWHRSVYIFNNTDKPILPLTCAYKSIGTRNDQPNFFHA